MTCTHCGADLPEQAAVCENCGKPVTAQPKHPFRFWLLLCLIIPPILIAATAVYTHFYNQSHPTESAAEASAAETVPVISRPHAALICEDETLLPAEETEALADRLEETAQYLNMSVGVHIGAEPLTQQMEARSQSIQDYTDCFGEAADGVWLYLDCSAKTPYEENVHHYLLTSGAAQLYYTNAPDYDRIYAIFQQLAPALQVSAEDPVQAVHLFCNALEQYYDIGFPSDYYVYDEDAEQYLYQQDGEIAWHEEPPVWAEE